MSDDGSKKDGEGSEHEEEEMGLTKEE